MKAWFVFSGLRASDIKYSPKKGFQAEDGLAHGLRRPALHKELHQNPDENKRPDDIIKLEHDDLGCDRGADVDTEDDAHRLTQGHQPSIHESDEHNGRR